MKIKTSELTGHALRYAVACAEGMSFPHLKHCEWPDDHEWVLHPDGSIRHAVDDTGNGMNRHYDYTFWMPDQDWSQGGPIIDREDITVGPWDTSPARAIKGHNHDYKPTYTSVGPTKLIAAMRCYVASKLGDEVDVPEELP